MKCKDIRKIVENEFEVDSIYAYNRKRKISDIRHVYFKLCRTYADDNTVINIANSVGLQNHTSVLHGIKTFDQWKGLKYMSYYSELYYKIKSRLS